MAYDWNIPATSPGVPVGFSIQNAKVGIDITADWLSETGRNPTDLAELMGQVKDALEGAGLTVGEIHARSAVNATLEQV